ncbi:MULTISPECIES: nucleoside diphosphate kinase regulator [unclassified Duganella]|uniref:nucleoside diphosphate kinase regulator n=1 Tax=unclassified Duganella TaxID=2636909 RepID=UPI000889ABC8|nr:MULTISPECIES: nucleoside diphosphate kinase regulator [unclassified Duganella]SDH02265.1 GreA/GreB family elongation factor [Duganella sp. OV458]SDK23952.1 regulator of nucleoside diphosphate kinase [Duganella sp. OV510]
MKPHITVSTLDIERLETLLETHHNQALQDELARAKAVEPEDIPSDVVTMRSQVRFEIEQPPQQLCLTLAYPKDMPELEDGISILTPIGTALLGLKVGDSIDWPRPDGQMTTLRILEVPYQPERAGETFR